MATLRIPGTKETLPASSELEGRRAGGLLAVKRVGAFRVDAARAAAGEAVTLKDVAEDDVIEIELDDGIRLWTSVAQMREDLPAGAVRGEPTGELVIPAELPFGTPSRGIGSWALKALRVFNVDLAEESAVAIAGKLEDQLEPGPGLYRCAPSGKLKLERLAPGATPFSGDAPGLLFIHGTASSTEGSFGGLWEPERTHLREGLLEHFRGNLFGFQHRTLTESPIENAVALARQLPEGARLNIVSHSRGGLVGELLCRSFLEGGREPFDADERALFQGKDREKDREKLAELNQLLKTKGFRVERFVRVACPARGTTLASKRLDRYLSIIVNAIGLIPALKASPIYEFVTDFLLAMVKTRTKPDELPGLEAMMPESPLVRLLNRPGVRADADLRVIAGDVEGEGLWGRLKVLATDLFYREDHDLVVNTSAMKGGTERKESPRLVFDHGAGVNHFQYFRNERTAARLFDGLTAEKDKEDGFEPFVIPREITQRSYGRRGGPPQPVVFVIPGIMGSHLAVGEDRVWLDPPDIALGGFDKLHIESTGVVPQAPLAGAYLDLIEYLQATHEVIAFPFDWRRSILEEARRLGDAVATRLDEAEKGEQPVRLLGHSMGGLVARAMIAERPEVWRRMCRHPGGRLIMLGTPNGGSHVVPRLLLGRERVLRQLALIDLKHSPKELLEIVSAYPGVLEMLPVSGNFDFFGTQVWEKLKAVDGDGWVVPGESVLENAKAFRKILDASPVDPERMGYVAGCAPATPIDLEIDSGAKQIRFLATARGDGRVPWDTGSLPNVKTWYMDAAHGRLADHEPAFPAILDLLQSGHTTRLPTTPPVPERGVPERSILPDDEITIYPDAEEIEAAALGYEHRPPRIREEPKVGVSVVHGNLAYARHPVAVGHYQGDTIVSAEAYLDRVLDGRLRAHNQLGLYPGPSGTAEVFLNPGGKPSGAIVVGLGRVGELTPGTLTSSFARAALMYAVTLAEKGDSRQTASLTTLLIGTGAGGLSVEDSVSAILQAVGQANRALMETGFAKRVTIDELEFVELYEDRAIQAGRALQRIALQAEFQGRFTVRPRLGQVKGGKKRVAFEEDPNWWRRLQIVAQEDGTLAFSSLTDRARAEVSLQPTQRALIDRFVEQAIAKTRSEDQLSRTLFELLIPNRLKDQAPQRQDLVLVVDEEAARYPWELLQDRFREKDRPLAVEAGVVRQLQTQRFRERVVMATQKAALVVGDPPSGFAELKGAQKEARQVAGALKKSGFTVTERIRPGADPDSVIKALYAEDYRILHLAGHGVFEYCPSAEPKTCADCLETHTCKGHGITGMVLGEGIYLTPTEVNQMRQVPELVFINCCHLGRTASPDQRERRDRHKLAANLATQLIHMGVRAVVAAGWAVDDKAATTFALEFYRQMLSGTPFGRAVRGARSKTFEESPDVNTWGAYQCYGDPDYSLVARASITSEQGEETRFFALAEVLSELENVASDAATATGERAGELRASVRRIEEELPPEWLEEAPVRAALGQAYGELDAFDKAIEHYKEALRVEKADFSVKTVEQLANLQSRYAFNVWRARGETKEILPKPAALIDEARSYLEMVLQLGQTVERLSLMGSAYKRLALVTERKARQEALEKMTDSYGEAHKLALEKTGEVDPYPLSNWLVGLLLHDWGKKTRRHRRQIGRWLGEAESVAEARDKRDPNFWNGITRTESLLLRHLAEGDLDQHQDEIVDGYLRAYRRGASPKEFRSVLDQLLFLVEMTKTEIAEESLRNRLRDGLTGIYAQLEAGL